MGVSSLFLAFSLVMHQSDTLDQDWPTPDPE